jgi:hypothetical protein
MPRYRDLALENLRKHRPQELARLKAEGGLEAHLADLEEQANAMRDSLESQMRKKQLKPGMPDLERAAVTRQIWRTADEIVRAELIQLPDPETEKAISRGGYED